MEAVENTGAGSAEMSTSGTNSSAPQPAATTRYIVQRKDEMLDAVDRQVTVWVDVITVDVPQRSKRALAVREALAKTDVVVTEEGVTFRVLTEECAEEIVARTENTPQLVIG